MQRSYFDKRFGHNKRQIEVSNANKVLERGGWFGLTHLSVMEHYHRFKPMLRPRSPFIIVERNEDTYWEIDNIVRSKLRKDNRVSVEQGDIFSEMFYRYPKTPFNTVHGVARYRTPLFRYAHLDFCCTAATLTDEGIERNIRKLAKWWAVKDIFYLEIVVAHRGDKNLKCSEILMRHFIPNTFEQLNWVVEEKTIRDYHDTSCMRNAFYKFKRQTSWKEGRSHYKQVEI